MHANKKYKDTVFTLLFRDETKLIELYNAVGSANYAPDTEVKINTLEKALYLDRNNDVSFTIGDKLVVLIEHQSTINENMPLRFLLYITRVYEKIITNQAIYSSHLVKIPSPEFIVLYNGIEAYPDKKVLKLSNAYKEKSSEPGLELSVTIYNINKGRNGMIVQKSKSLSGYVQFVSRVKENIKDGLSLEDAIDEAITYCIDHEILGDFLAANGSEVKNMLYTEFNMDDAIKVWKKEGLEEGLEEGLKKGRQEERLSLAKSLLADDIAIDKIIQYTGLTKEEIQKLKIADRG